MNAGLGSLSPFHSVCDPSLVDGAALIQGVSPLLSIKPFLEVPSQTHLEECLLDDSRSCQVGSTQLAITDTPESRQTHASIPIILRINPHSLISLV